MAEQRENTGTEKTEQDARQGGYGDSSGTEQAGRKPAGARPQGDSAVGRENPAESPVDGDEAQGNRVGYGRAPLDRPGGR